DVSGGKAGHGQSDQQLAFRPRLCAVGAGGIESRGAIAEVRDGPDDPLCRKASRPFDPQLAAGKVETRNLYAWQLADSAFDLRQATAAVRAAHHYVQRSAATLFRYER